MRQKRNRLIWYLAMGVILGTIGCGAEIPEELPDAVVEQEESGASESEQEIREENVSVAEGSQGEAELNLTFSLVSGEAAAAGLSEEAKAQIEAINRGVPPADAIGSEILEGYYALVATYTVVGRDAESGDEVTGSGRLTLYIPNLLAGLDDISFLFYDKAEAGWKIIPAERMDTEAKTVSAILPGSGTLTVIYKRQ